METVPPDSTEHREREETGPGVQARSSSWEQCLQVDTRVCTSSSDTYSITGEGRSQSAWQGRRRLRDTLGGERLAIHELWLMLADHVLTKKQPGWWLGIHAGLSS